MSWIILSLGAGACWGIVNVIDKYVLSGLSIPSRVYLLLGGFTSLIPVVIIYSLSPLSTVSLYVVLLSMANGAALLTYTYFFFLSLTKDDAPVVVALFQLVPVFSVALGALFFGERFSLLAYLGIFLVLTGVTLISVQASDGLARPLCRLSSALWLMVVSTSIASLSYALQKYLVSQADFLTVFFWARVGDVLCASLLFLTFRPLRLDFIANIKTLFGKLLAINLFNEMINSLALLLLMIGYSKGSLGLVTTLAATQPLFVLIFIRIVNRVKKGQIEDTSYGMTFVKRLLLITVILLGVFLISNYT